MCFEILGFDIFLDQKLRPWILEVNHTPSFTTDTPLDLKIKKGVITDSLHLLTLSVRRRNKYKLQKKQEFQKRVISGKHQRISNEEKEALKIEKERKRLEWELKNTGDFTLVYPAKSEEEMREYDAFMAQAKVVFEEFTGAKKRPTDDEEEKAKQL